LLVESPISPGIVILIVFGCALREWVRLKVTVKEAGKLLVYCKLKTEFIRSIFPGAINPLMLKIP